MIKAQTLNLGTADPVWSVSGLTTLEQRQSIRKAILDQADRMPDSFALAKDGKKLSLEHKSSKGMRLFNHEAVIELSSSILSGPVIDLLSRNLRQSNSRFNSNVDSNFHSLRPVNIQRWRYLSESRKYSSSWLNKPSLDSSQLVRQITHNYSLAYDAVPFIPNMQFSIMRRGSYIPPHTDISNKIATLMIYLPSQKQTNLPLGTTFWSPKSSRQLLQDESCFLKDSHFSTFRKCYEPIRTPFEGENAILFYRSNSSWHSFEFENSIDDEPRVSININLLYPVSTKL